MFNQLFSVDQSPIALYAHTSHILGILERMAPPKNKSPLVAHGLTSRQFPEIVWHSLTGRLRMISLDWQKIRTELAKIKDMQTLKEELHKLSVEIKKMDLDTKLVPQAKKQLATLQNRYETFVVQLSSAQKQLDREFNRVWRQMRQTKVQAQSTLKMAKKDVLKHGTNLDKMAKSLAKTIATSASSTAKASTKRATQKRASPGTKIRKSGQTTKTSKRKISEVQ